MQWGETELSTDWRNCDSVQKTRCFPHTRRAALGERRGTFLGSGEDRFRRRCGAEGGVGRGIFCDLCRILAFLRGLHLSGIF